MSTLQKLRSTAVSPGMALLSVALFLLATGGIVWLVLQQLGVFATAPIRRAPLRPTPSAAETRARPGSVKGAPLPASAYAIITTRNLFRAPAAPTPPALPLFDESPKETPVAPSPAVVALPTPVKVVLPPPPPAALPRPRLVCTGVVTIGDENYALLENLDTNEAHYARAGSTVLGCQVVSIGTQAISLQANGETYELALGDGKPDPEPTKAPPPPPAPPAATPPPTGDRPDGASYNGRTGRPTGESIIIPDGGPDRSWRRRSTREGN
jgi:hypothetical protein